MDVYANPLATFTTWLHRGQHDPRYMAAAGFYQDHTWPEHADAATCFHCDCTFTGWVAGEDPATEHIKCQPLCTWIVSKTMNTPEKREGTFNNWPFDGVLSHIMVAAAGFYQSDWTNHGVTCYSCQLTLQPVELLPDPLEAHGRFLLIGSCAVATRKSAQIQRKAAFQAPTREIASLNPQLILGPGPRGPCLPLSPPASPASSATKCEWCGKQFETRAEVFRHLRVVHKLNKCRKCRKRFPSGDKLADHLLAAHVVPKVIKVTEKGGRKVPLTGKIVKGSKRRRRNQGAKARASPWDWMWRQDHDDHEEVKIKQEPGTENALQQLK